MVEGDAHALVKVGAEQRDLGVSLTEVVQHDELSVHTHPNTDGLRCRTAGGTTHTHTIRCTCDSHPAN